MILFMCDEGRAEHVYIPSTLSLYCKLYEMIKLLARLRTFTYNIFMAMICVWEVYQFGYFWVCRK